jgi:hypothetical protein
VREDRATNLPESGADDDTTRILERAGGFYWQRRDDGREFGPFATLAEAIADRESADSDQEAGEPLDEAKSEIGIANWIDPDTGQPAEESIPRIDDN